jgi:hypothetical protein
LWGIFDPEPKIPQQLEFHYFVKIPALKSLMNIILSMFGFYCARYMKTRQLPYPQLKKLTGVKVVVGNNLSSHINVININFKLIKK